MNTEHSRTMLVRTCAMLLALGVGLSGCSDNGLTKVSGTVSLDGAPVPDGSISFMPVDGKGVTAGGQIEDGKYSADVSPGEMAVQIYATRDVPKENPTQEEMERGITSDPVQYIPTRYNRESTLRITVSDTSRDHDFVLTTAAETSG